MLGQSDDLDPAGTVRHAIVGECPEHKWAGDPAIRDVISEASSPTSPWDARIGELSGGQRRRVALAALLIDDWDLIALDEPTNHLDVEGITWLAGHLRRRWGEERGGLLVITHDRWFLDEVCTQTWEVHDGIVEPFEGGYAAYVLQRVERDRMAGGRRGQAPEPHAQGARLAQPRRAGAHVEAEVPDRRGECAHRGRSARARLRRSCRSSRSPGSAKTSSTCSTRASPSTGAPCCTTSNGGSLRASAPASSARTAWASRRCWD